MTVTPVETGGYILLVIFVIIIENAAHFRAIYTCCVNFIYLFSYVNIFFCVFIVYFYCIITIRCFVSSLFTIIVAMAHTFKHRLSLVLGFIVIYSL